MVIELLLSLLVSVGLVSDSRTAIESVRADHRPTFAEVVCFVECPEHCLWPGMPRP